MLVVPDLAIGQIEQARKHEQEDDHAEAELFALFHLGLRRPGEERHDVFGFLLDVASVPSEKVTEPSVSGGGMEMFRPSKYGL